MKQHLQLQMVSTGPEKEQTSRQLLTELKLYGDVDVNKSIDDRNPTQNEQLQQSAGEEQQPQNNVNIANQTPQEPEEQKETQTSIAIEQSLQSETEQYEVN